jgi:hypothetical protein
VVELREAGRHMLRGTTSTVAPRGNSGPGHPSERGEGQGRRSDLVGNFAKGLAKSFRAGIDRLKITDPVAIDAQRIACLPPEELEAFLQA